VILREKVREKKRLHRENVVWEKTTPWLRRKRGNLEKSKKASKRYSTQRREEAGGVIS